MTENKIKPTISQVIYCLKAESERYPEVCEECQLYGEVGCDHCYDDVTDMAIKSLKELEQYRAIETELRDRYHANVDIKMLMKHFIETIFKGEKHEGFCILTNEDAKMWDEYRAIGTAEEFKALKEKDGDCIIKHLTNECSYNETGCSDCKSKEMIRVAVERMKPKKPKECKAWNTMICPNYSNNVAAKEKMTFKFKYCCNCGQAIDWSEYS